jgi:predicted DNA-binding protein with PD1-like motif
VTLDEQLELLSLIGDVAMQDESLSFKRMSIRSAASIE